MVWGGGSCELIDRRRAGGGGVRGADEEVVSLLAHLERRRQPRHQQAATPPFPDPHHIHRQARPPRTSLASVPFPQHALATPPPPTPANTSLDTRPFRYHTSHPTTHELRSFPLYRRRILCAAAFSRVAARCCLRHARLPPPGASRPRPAPFPGMLAGAVSLGETAALPARLSAQTAERRKAPHLCHQRRPSAVSRGETAASQRRGPARKRPGRRGRKRPRQREEQGRPRGPRAGPPEGSKRRAALLFSPQEGSLRRADRGAGGGWQQGHFL